MKREKDIKNNNTKCLYACKRCNRLHVEGEKISQGFYSCV